jgi:hypothetical protein
MQNGAMNFGSKKYRTLFLLSMHSMDAATAKKLLEFVKCGGRIFCVDGIPSTGIGLLNKDAKDNALKAVIEELVSFKNNFIILHKPESNCIAWFKDLQQQYNITPYLTINGVNPFIQQIRYSTGTADMIFVVNSSNTNSYEVNIVPDESMIKGREAYVWDAVTGNRYKLENKEAWNFTLAAADSRLIVCESDKKIKAGVYKEVLPAQQAKLLADDWELEFVPINNGEVKKVKMQELKDIRESDFVNFTGKIIYRKSFRGKADWLDLGVVHGLSDVKVNGKDVGVRWYGRHLYPVKDFLNNDVNHVEVSVVVVMCNYMKSLKDNPIAQGWTRNQSLQSMGLIGPVTLF